METSEKIETVNNPAENAAEKDIETILAELKAAKDKTAEFDPRDIADNKAIAILSYLFWLVLIPIFAARNSKFARFHANQGLVMAVIETGYILASYIINEIVYSISLKYGTLVSTVLFLFGISFAILSVIGVINAASGKAKQLPTFGGITILK
jgi:uncharacterized membrane protein